MLASDIPVAHRPPGGYGDVTTEITVVATYEDGVRVLRPGGLPGVEVTHHRQGEQIVWTYPGSTARLARLGPADGAAR